jgi:hypothetical protein
VLQALDRLRQCVSELLSGLQIMLQQMISHAPRRPDTHTRQAFERLHECEQRLRFRADFFHMN